MTLQDMTVPPPTVLIGLDPEWAQPLPRLRPLRRVRQARKQTLYSLTYTLLGARTTSLHHTQLSTQAYTLFKRTGQLAPSAHQLSLNRRTHLV